MTARRAPLATLLVLSLPTAAVVTAEAAEAPLAGPEVAQRRGLTTVVFRGRLQDELGGRELVARLRRDGRAALATPVRIAADGSCEVEFRTPGLLLADRYVLELSAPGPAGAALLEQPFQLGDDAEVGDARRRMLAWYGAGAGTLRDLSAALERRGAFHLALGGPDEEARRLQRALFREDFLEEWSAGLRRAAMDLTTWQRRLHLPYRAELGEDLRALVPLLRERAVAWGLALDGDGQPPGANVAVEAVASRLLAGLGEDPALLAGWRAGLLGEPPATARPGEVYRSPLGFQLALPPAAAPSPPTNPVERLAFRIGGVNASLRIQDLPGEDTTDALGERLEVAAWEQWESYKRISGGPIGPGGAAGDGADGAAHDAPDGAAGGGAAAGDGGYQLEFTCRLRDRGSGRYTMARVVQRSLFPRGGGRAVTLLVLRPEGVPWTDELEALVASFALVPPGDGR